MKVKIRKNKTKNKKKVPEDSLKFELHYKIEIFLPLYTAL